MKREIRKKLIEALKTVDVVDVPVQIDIPADSRNGDYSTNVALIAAKKLGTNPRELAQNIVDALRAHEKELSVEIAGPGFINFFLSNESLLHNLPNASIIEKIVEEKKVVVEYSSPNIAKPFTVGHLRSTIIGDAVANLLESVGWTVYRDNHLGDWGTQFGKQIYAIKAWGNENEIEKADRPVRLLVDLYVKFHNEAEAHPEIEDEARAWFRKLESGDPEARRLWEKCVDWSWKEFESIYRELRVSFTENNGRGYGESYFEDKMAPVVDELKEKRLLQEGEEGAKLIFFPADSYPPLMILKKDGSTLYATRDLATDKFRLEQYGKDIIVINEIGGEQSLYMQQIFEVERMLGWYKEGQRVHIKHGLFRFKEGKMSTRKGNVVWLEDVLLEAVKRAERLGGLEREENSELAKKVGIGAIKWNDLKRDSKQDIVFDWDDILNMQGNSGPYMQYTYARTRSVLAKVNQSFQAINHVNLELGLEERKLLVLLSQFGETVEESAERFAPNILCNYLFELAQTFNVFYQKYPILKADTEVRELRIVITDVVGKVIMRGLNLLGIQAPEKM